PRRNPSSFCSGRWWGEGRGKGGWDFEAILQRCAKIIVLLFGGAEGRGRERWRGEGGGEGRVRGGERRGAGGVWEREGGEGKGGEGKGGEGECKAIIKLRAKISFETVEWAVCSGGGGGGLGRVW
ncbi:unnamed protein product, partial [Closterium sp. NIES-54]